MGTTYTLIGGVSDVLAPFPDGKVVAWVGYANLPSDGLMDTAANTLVLGHWPVNLEPNGIDFNLTLPSTSPGAGYDPNGGFFYRLFVEYRSAAPYSTREAYISAPFTMPSTRTLTAALGGSVTLTQMSVADYDAMWAAVAYAEAAQAAAEAARDAAVDISGISTSDGVVETLVKGTAGAGPLTRAALEAAYVSEGQERIRTGATAFPDSDPSQYTKVYSKHANSTGMVIWTQKVAGDSDDVNVDGSVLVKHGKDYAATPGYTDTFQVYSLAGSSGTIIGNNDYSGYESTLPYLPNPALPNYGKGFVRFELGPWWPASEVGRFNNSGDFMAGGFVIHKTWDTSPAKTFTQSGTTITQVGGADMFDASDVGRYFLWAGPGTDGTCDRIMTYVNSTTVTVESTRTFATAKGGSVVTSRFLFSNAYYSLTTATGEFTINNPIPVTFGVTNPMAIVKPTQTTDAAADFHITTQGDTDKGIVIRPHAGTQTGNLFETQTAAGVATFAVDAAGVPWWKTANNTQPTVGATGAASTLPAKPAIYLNVRTDDGTLLVIPAYYP